MDDARLNWVIETLLAAPPAERITPSRAMFLLHEYARRGRDEVRHAAETALTSALDDLPDVRDPFDRCQWLGALTAARSFTNDERLDQAVQRLLPDAIDQLEQEVRAAYEPGDGLYERPLEDQVRAAAALVTAFELTGRLPYSMLAEELVQFTRRGWWDDAAGALKGSFRVNCAASQLCARLALLHREPDYRSSAVLAAGADYTRDAERLLLWTEATYRHHRDAAAEFGMAIVHGFALRAHPN